MEWADLVVKNYEPSHLESHGPDFPALEKVSPLVNLVSITYYGYDAPNRD